MALNYFENSGGLNRTGFDSLAFRLIGVGAGRLSFPHSPIGGNNQWKIKYIA